MPELPEVETVTRQLKQTIKGLVISNIEVRKAKIFHGNPNKAIGTKITDIYRRGKMIIFKLKLSHPEFISGSKQKEIPGQARNDECYLLFHLKMSGQLVYEDKNGKYGGGHPVPPFDDVMPGKHTRVIFTFSDKSHLYFNEMRMFGWVKLVRENELEKELKNIGIEPLSSNFTLNKFKEILANKKNLNVKQVLMEQSLIAGIGNIYASEICFYAKVRPSRQIKMLKDAEIKLLFNGIKIILAESIEHQGTSAKQYVTLQGKPGGFDKLLKVYGRKDQKCYRCGSKIIREKIAGRGTFYCPKCQK